MSISVASAAGKSANSQALTIEAQRAAAGGVRAFDFQADHEARGIPEIVSEGRPHADRYANRIARAQQTELLGTGAPEPSVRTRGEEKDRAVARRFDVILPTSPASAGLDTTQEEITTGSAARLSTRIGLSDNITPGKPTPASKDGKRRVTEGAATPFRRVYESAAVRHGASLPARRRASSVEPCQPSGARFGNLISRRDK